MSDNTEAKPSPRRVMLALGGTGLGVSHAQLVELIQAQAARNGVDILLIDPNEVQAARKEGERVAVVDGTDEAVRQRLREILDAMETAAMWRVPTEHYPDFDAPEPPVVTSPPKLLKQKSNFQQFQHNLNKGRPNTRRQFAVMRPPRRGGR